MNERAAFLCDTSGDTLIVYIRGEIDHHTAVGVRNGIDTVLFEKRPTRLILDLSGVGFMDSSGLGLIMGRLSVMRSLGGDILLREPGREIRAILSLAGMERLIPIEYGREVEDTPQKPCVPPRTAAKTVSRGSGGGSRSRRKNVTPDTSA